MCAELTLQPLGVVFLGFEFFFRDFAVMGLDAGNASHVDHPEHEHEQRARVVCDWCGRLGCVLHVRGVSMLRKYIKWSLIVYDYPFDLAPAGGWFSGLWFGVQRLGVLVGEFPRLG